MTVYKYVPDSDNYEYIYAKPEDRDMLYFNHAMPLAATWKSPLVLADERVMSNIIAIQRGDFPSLYRSTPIFSKRAWFVLSPLIVDLVECLPIIHPSGDLYYAINVLRVIDCLDHSQSCISYNDATGRVSSISRYQFNSDALGGIHIFKLPETIGLEVYVSEEFKLAVEQHELRGIKLPQIFNTNV